MLLLPAAAPVKQFALWQLGFRPFFLAASLFAVLSILIWSALYSFNWQGLPTQYPAMLWHAHEMIFGYALAVIAGFLLTAVKNWTGIQTLQDTSLAILVLLWLLARIAPFTGFSLLVTALLDLGFQLVLLYSIAKPITQVKQWKQLGILAKLGLLLITNSLFYFALLTDWFLGMRLAVYMALYLVIALMLTMGRRVIPFFIERGVGVPFTAKNSAWIDRLSLVSFLLLAVIDLIVIATGNSIANYLVVGLALLQLLLHSIRLTAWYHPAIWQKPLLWVLYLAYACLVLGFALKVISAWGLVSPWLAVHAFAYGGIGLMTLGMMARVSLGHTGRDIAKAPKILSLFFILLVIGVVFRVGLVGAFTQLHFVWMLIAQACWIGAFLGFMRVYLPFWLKPRVV